MKKILILTINFYQGFISSFLKNILGIERMCKSTPTCSEYAKIKIQKDGVINGLFKVSIRILTCF